MSFWRHLMWNSCLVLVHSRIKSSDLYFAYSISHIWYSRTAFVDYFILIVLLIAARWCLRSFQPKPKPWFYNSMTWNDGSVYQVRLAMLHHFPKVNISLEILVKSLFLRKLPPHGRKWSVNELPSHSPWAADLHSLTATAEVVAVRQGSFSFKNCREKYCEHAWNPRDLLCWLTRGETLTVHSADSVACPTHSQRASFFSIQFIALFIILH